MNWQWLLLFLTSYTLINAVENKEIVAQINTKRLIHYVPDRFLSMSIDPTSIFLAGGLEEKALKMARGLYPSFVRLGGKATNYLKFGKELLVDNNTITEDQWDGVNNFVADAGLDLIVSLNPTHRVQGVWDSRDALQLISYSDKHGYNVAWQLGYDTQGHLSTDGEVGRDIVRLRKILDGFQRYATTPLFGPDLPDVYTLKESAFIKDMLVQAGPVLGAILVQMPFNNENPEQKIMNILFNMESHIWSREIRYGRMIPKKPIWIAEKHPSQGSVEDAISLAKYLGTAAQIGCQMVFRQVGPESLKNPTPDYWLALLYKNLVGRGVFDAKVTSGNKSEIVLFSHCSQTISQERSILDTGFNYDKGSVTIFGVNESPEIVKLTLKASMKDEKAHIYFLTFEDDPNGKPEKTFLNGQLLTSSPSGDLPIISPKIKRTIKYGINVPPKSIFFIVLPDLKSRTCTSTSPYLSPDVQSLSKKLIHVVADVLEKPSNDLKSEEEDPENVYVKFSKSTAMQNLDNKPSHVQEDSEPDVQVKYITFNDNSWLSKLTETMGNPKLYEQSNEHANSGNKYATLTAAITGSDNLTNIVSADSAPSIVLSDSTPSIVLSDTEPSNHQKRKRRSINEHSITETDTSTYNEKHSVASQEDLVKHLNEYASTVYKKSQIDKDSDKEIQISNIPPLIFDTLKKVKVTFRKLKNKNSQKDGTDYTNTNESPSLEKTEDTKDGYLLGNDESFDHITLDHEKGIANPTIARDNKELYHYKVETLRNDHPIEIIQNFKNLGGNNYQDSNHGNAKKIDPVIISQPSQDKDTYQERIGKQLDVNEQSAEINDRPQEGIQPESNEKYTDQEIIPSDILASNQETPGETDELEDAKSQSDESPFSQKTEPRVETKESETNYILNDMPEVTATSLDNVEEPEKNTILMPINSVEPAVIPNLTDEQDKTNEETRIEADYDEKKPENNQDANELNDEVSLAKVDKKQDDEVLNGADEEEKAFSGLDNTEKENFPSVNGIISDEFHGSEKKNNNEDYTGGDELLLVKPKRTFASSMPIVYIPQQGSSEGPTSSSLIVPMTSQQQGLDEGPQPPSYNPEMVKVVQREIPMNEEMPVTMPMVMMVPINMVPEMQLQEDNEEEDKIKNDDIKMNLDAEDSQDVINPDSEDKNILDHSNGNRDEKDLLNEDTFNQSPLQTLDNKMKPFTDTKVVSFADVPLENVPGRSYGRTALPIITDQQNLMSSLENHIILENMKKELEAISNDSHEKKRAVPKTDERYSTEQITMPVLIMSPQGELQPLEKNTYMSDMETTVLPQIDNMPLKISQITDEKADNPPSNENLEKNSQDNIEREEGNVDRYKLLDKIISGQEVSNNKPEVVEKTEKSKADLEKERKERLQLLKKQIAEIREHFRTQVREEGLKAALQRREEEMRNYLNQDKEFKKKFFAYPLMNHDHNILSRPRRLSYFPESGISDEEECDYLDENAYKRRTDSYGLPIMDDYEKSYLTQQVISAPQRSLENNHILFPLDPKTPQALVYDDKIIPAKFFGMLSVNEEPSGTKLNDIATRQILDLPADNACQKCYLKQYDTQQILKESHPKISETSFESYLPKDTYIKSNNQPNYIPIVVLSTPIKNHRKRRSIANSDVYGKILSIKETRQKAGLRKRSVEQIPESERNTYLDRQFDYVNEIPIGSDNHLNSINYIHPNDMNIPKSDDVDINKFSKGYPEFLPSNNLPMDYIQSRQNVFHSPSLWNDVEGINDMEQRHFFQPSRPLPLVHPITSEEHSQEKDSPKFYIWSLMHDKFKTMLEMLKSLAEWCSSSSSK